MTVATLDEKETLFMSKALELGQRSRRLAQPNPWVGAVVVKNGEIISEGRTQSYGGDHAEVQALKAAGPDAEGSTLYVTLEPCSTHGQTPPCVDAIIAAKVKRVVISVVDPDSKERGRGIEKLKAAGIEIEVGLLEKEVTMSLKPYLHHRKTGLPYCVLKAAISMDGKIAAKDGSSIWITGSEARRDVHKIRAESGAILVGNVTALEDDPELTVRDVDFEDYRQPIRILVDTYGKVPATGKLFKSSLGPTWIFTSDKTEQKRIEEWQACGCEVEIMPLDAKGRGIDMQSVLRSIGKRGVVQLLVEGGSKIFSTLIEDKQVDQLVLYMGSCLLGAEGISLFSKLNLESIDDAIRLRLERMVRFRKDVRLDYTYS